MTRNTDDGPPTPLADWFRQRCLKLVPMGIVALTCALQHWSATPAAGGGEGKVAPEAVSHMWLRVWREVTTQHGTMLLALLLPLLVDDVCQLAKLAEFRYRTGRWSTSREPLLYGTSLDPPGIRLLEQFLKHDESQIVWQPGTFILPFECDWTAAAAAATDSRAKPQSAHSARRRHYRHELCVRLSIAPPTERSVSWPFVWQNRHDMAIVIQTSHWVKDTLVCASSEATVHAFLGAFAGWLDRHKIASQPKFAADYQRLGSSSTTVYRPSRDAKTAEWHPAASAGSQHSLATCLLSAKSRAALDRSMASYDAAVEHSSASLTNWFARKRVFLLHGQPGCGKTLLALALANHYRCTLYWISGECPSFCELLDQIRWSPQTMLLLDDVDLMNLSPTGLRGAKHARPKPGPGANQANQTNSEDGDAHQPQQTWAVAREPFSGLMELLDGYNMEHPPFVVLTTNRKSAFDPALLRAGRVTVDLDMGPMDADMWSDMWRQHLDAQLLLTESEQALLTEAAWTTAEAFRDVIQPLAAAGTDHKEMQQHVVHLSQLRITQAAAPPPLAAPTTSCSSMVLCTPELPRVGAVVFATDVT